MLFNHKYYRLTPKSVRVRVAVINIGSRISESSHWSWHCLVVRDGQQACKHTAAIFKALLH